MMIVRPRQPIQFAQMVVALCLALAGVPCYAASGDTSTSWNFDAIPQGTLPEGFKLGRLYDGRPAGDWKVLETRDAVSAPHVLAQLSDKGAEHAYKMVLIDGTDSLNVELSVSFAPSVGKGTWAGGSFGEPWMIAITISPARIPLNKTSACIESTKAFGRSLPIRITPLTSESGIDSGSSCRAARSRSFTTMRASLIGA